MQSKGERLPRRNAKRDALIAEVRKARGAASDKSYRLRKEGVNSKEVDPRSAVNGRQLGSLSTRELQTHLKALRGYTSRESQFVGGLNGTAIPRGVYEAYKAEEAKFNARGNALESRIANVKLPGQDMTVAGLLRQRREGKTAEGDSRIFAPINRQPFQFESADSVKTLIDNLRNKNRPGYLQDALKPRLNGLYALLQNSGNADFIPMVNKMNNQQLQILIDYSPFASIAKERFSSGDNSTIDKEDAAYFARTGVQREDDIRDELQEVFNWIVDQSLSDVANADSTLRGGSRRTGDSTVGRSGSLSRRSPKGKGRK